MCKINASNRHHRQRHSQCFVRAIMVKLLSEYIFDITSPGALGYEMKTKALYAAALTITVYFTSIDLVAQHEKGYDPSCPKSDFDAQHEYFHFNTADV